MRTVSISVTEASRNFADCVNRVRYQGTTFLLLKNGVAVARIAPVERKSKNIEELVADAGADRQAAEAEPATSIVRLPEIW